MSLADACLVRMTELLVPVRVMTTDWEFRLYCHREHRAHWIGR